MLAGEILLQKFVRLQMAQMTFVWLFMESVLPVLFRFWDFFDIIYRMGIFFICAFLNKKKSYFFNFLFYHTYPNKFCIFFFFFYWNQELYKK